MSEKLKLGEGRYAFRGTGGDGAERYVIIGLPKAGVQWVTIAPESGGGVESMPQSVFDASLYRVD